jgi:hypothetical protein
MYVFIVLPFFYIGLIVLLGAQRDFLRGCAFLIHRIDKAIRPSPACCNAAIDSQPIAIPHLPIAALIEGCMPNLMLTILDHCVSPLYYIVLLGTQECKRSL